MTSFAPNTQSYNFTHMYDFEDLRTTKKPIPCVTQGSMYDFLYKNKSKFSKFLTILERSGMIGQLNNIEANFTLFVPDDRYLSHIPDEFFTYMDNGLAKQIFHSSSIIRKLDKKLLTSSPVAYYITQNPQMRMYVTNISGKTVLNNCATVRHFDIELNNGYIHVIDNVLAPNDDHFMN